MSTFCNYWNKVSLVKSKIKKSKKIDSIGIGLASPEEIRRWGERQLPNGTLIGKVDKDHTVDYESLKPIEGGLFCERIFGPVEDFYCSCERKGEKNEKFCPTCEVEFTKSRVRRIRMGYIPLAVPVVHVWYLRGRPSYIANLVGKSRNSIDRLAYGETLSESFIGYSSLESIYKKEENVFPKRLQDTVKFNSAAELRLPHANQRFAYPEGVWGMRSKKSNYDGKDLITSNQDTNQRKLTNSLQIEDLHETSVALEEWNSLPLTGSGVVLTNCVNDTSFSNSSFSSLISNQNFTIPKKLYYSKGLNTSNISNGVPLNESSLTHNKSSIYPISLQGLQSEALLTPYPERVKGYGVKVAERQSQVNTTPLTRGWFFQNSLEALLRSYPHVKWDTSYKWQRSVGSSICNICTARVNPRRRKPFTLYPKRAFFEREAGKFISTEYPSVRSSAALVSKGYKATILQPLQSNPFVIAEKLVAGGSRAEKYPKEILFGHKQKYLKCHTLPLFSTFVYKEWAHRFSFLEYFIWSARNNDLVLPFYAYQNSKSKKSLANICESIRKSSINLVRNKFSLRFSNKSNCNDNSLLRTRSSATLRQLVNCLPATLYPFRVQQKAPLPLQGFLRTRSNGYMENLQRVPPASTKVIAYAARDKEFLKRYASSFGTSPLVNKNILKEQKVQRHFLQLRNKQGLLRVVKVKKDRGSDATLLARGTPSYALPSSVAELRTEQSFAKGTEESPSSVRVKGFPLYPERVKRSWELPLQGFLQYPERSISVERSKGLRNCYAFSTIQQDTESTPLNKMDTQQFPRLTELLSFTGGAALRNLLSRFDLIVLSKFLRHELKNLELKVNSLLALKILTYSQGLLLGKLAKRRSKQIRRLKLLELFQSQKSNPEWMILSVIPVLPPDLRPILRVNDDFVVASDLNRLYQTVLRRNNTIHERLDDPLPCPESGLFRQRSLQKAVDGLLENGKGGGTPLCASKRRPLVSLSHVLKGKKGLFRQHLLGKRVDYSGRSVIVVGPRLQVHECGLPKEMAIELFQPFLLHRLKVKGLATSNTTARRMIQQGNPVIWHLLKQLIYEHPVLLNRAPTLHRLGIQAFQPRLVSGRAILLHPLVCNGFNADFDGDQMAVHVPLSFQARAEAWKIMWSKNNFLSPATGQPILVPSQDMVLGCYYLSVSIPRILNANVSIVSHDKAMTDNSAVEAQLTPYPIPHTLTGIAKQSFEYPEGVRGKQIEDLHGVSKSSIYPSGVSKGIANSLQYPFTPSGYGVKSFEYPEGVRSKALPNQRSLPRIPQRGNGSSAALLAKMQSKHVSKLGISTANQNLRSKAFLNENKGQYFSNLQDSLLAYFQGRLQTHTPFWVRIDHKFARENIASNNSSFSFFNDSSIPPATLYPQLRVRRKPFQGIQSKALQRVKPSWSSPFFKASKGYGTLLPKVQELLAVNEKIAKEKLNDLAEANSEAELRVAERQSKTFTNRNRRKIKGVPNVQYAYPLPLQGTQSEALQSPYPIPLQGLQSEALHGVRGKQIEDLHGVKLMSRPNINIENLKALKLTFLHPLYGSSRQICKAFFQNKSANNFQIRVEANETLESPLELRLGVDGNLANILTMFQNHYNYNATWVKQCKEESIKYMRTTAGRVVINDVVFKDF